MLHRLSTLSLSKDEEGYGQAIERMVGEIWEVVLRASGDKGEGKKRSRKDVAEEEEEHECDH